MTSLSGCADHPEFKDITSARAIAADYPTLVNIDTLMTHGHGSRVNAQTGGALSARAAALRERANRLRRPVIEPARRKAMRQAVAARQ